MNKWLSIIIIVFFFSLATLHAAFSNSDVGTASVPFLKLGAGARAAAMGDAFVALADDAAAIYWNPAGLDEINGGSLSVMHGAWVEGVSYDWVAVAQPTKYGTFGLGMQYLSWGDLERRDSSGIQYGSFSPHDTAVTVSFAREIRGTAVGVNIKYISSAIEEKAQTFAGDVGCRVRLPDNRGMAGVVVRNIGTGMRYVEKVEPLPFTIAVGGGYRMTEKWLVSADINVPVDNRPFPCVGTEYAYPLNDRFTIAARAGYSGQGTEMSDMSGLRMGGGIGFNGYLFDYAFMPAGDFGSVHRVSFTARF